MIQVHLRHSDSLRPGYARILRFLHQYVIVVIEHGESGANDSGLTCAIGDAKTRLESLIVRIIVGLAYIRLGIQWRNSAGDQKVAGQDI